jgi:hypothetical protein
MSMTKTTRGMLQPPRRKIFKQFNTHEHHIVGSLFCQLLNFRAGRGKDKLLGELSRVCLLSVWFGPPERGPR